LYAESNRANEGEDIPATEGIGGNLQLAIRWWSCQMFANESENNGTLSDGLLTNAYSS
jgi:hypothetical protein